MTSTALHLVAARSTKDRVIPQPRNDHITARTGPNQVIVRLACQKALLIFVAGGKAHQQIVAVATPHRVVARLAKQLVVACAPVESCASLSSTR